MEVSATGGMHAPPPAADPASAAVAEGEAALGASDVPVLRSPSPRQAPAAAVEVVPAVVDEQPTVMPAAAAAAVASDAWWSKERVINMGFFMLTIAILGIIFITHMGVNLTHWWGELAAMTTTEWVSAVFLTAGDVASLLLIFSPSRHFLRLCTGGAARLVTVVHPLAGVVNCGVWLAYGAVLEAKNVSVIVVNITGVLFNIGYTVVFYFCSGNPRSRTWPIICVAAVVAVMIAATDQCMLINTLGWKAPEAVGLSCLITACLTYFSRLIASMVAACQDRGASGFSAPALLSFGNALLWFAYGWFQNDKNMMTSNGVGILCFLIQAGQLVFFHFKKPRQEGAEEIRRNLLETLA